MTLIDLIQSDLKGRGRREEGGRDREERFLTGEEKEEEEVVTRGDCGGKQRWRRGKGKLRSLRRGDWWETESEERREERSRRGGEGEEEEGERGETGKRRQNVRTDRRYRSSCSSAKEPRALHIRGRYFIGGDGTKTEPARRQRKLHWAEDPRWDLRGNIWKSHRGCCRTRKANSVTFFSCCYIWHRGRAGGHVLHRSFKKGLQSERSF